MLPTIIRIPHAIGPLPVFGWGLILLLWALAGCVAAIVAWRQRKLGEFVQQVPFLLIVAAVIIFLLPQIEERDLHGRPLGLAIRGYGVLMLIGVVSGVGLAVRRARSVGLDVDVIFSLAFWMFVFGIAGARLFYVIEYWPEFQRPTWPATLMQILKFTEGGLVVYGSILGALGAAAGVLAARRLPVLAIADVIAPSLAIGLAFGRIGCLLNGCCYGGVTEGMLPQLHFPFGSPPYLHQFQEGRLLGLSVQRDHDSRQWIVTHVRPDSPAAERGVVAGDKFEAVLIANPKELLLAVAEDPARDVFILDSRSAGRSIRWTAAQLPKVSRPVHPTQLYAAFNAFLLTGLTWWLYPLRRRDGVVFATLFTLYPISRFLLEVIRTDEGGQFGSSLTISQWLCLGTLCAIAVLWLFIWRTRRPATTNFPSPVAATTKA